MLLASILDANFLNSKITLCIGLLAHIACERLELLELQPLLIGKMEHANEGRLERHIVRIQALLLKIHALQ